MFNVCRGQLLQIYSTFAATFSILSYGVQHGWTAPAIAKLQSNETLTSVTDEELSWLASIEMITIAVMAIVMVNTLQYLSARTVCILQVVPSMLGWLLIAFGNHIYYFYVSRIIVGFVDVLDYISVPIYLSEISNPEIRGGLMCVIPAMYFTGSMYSYFFGYLLSIRTFALISLVIPLINGLLMYHLPQSPYYLIFHNHFDEGKQVLERLRGRSNVDVEFEIIKADLEEQKLQNPSWYEFFSNPLNRKAFLIVFLVTIFQQTAGGQTIGSYLHSILEETNLGINIEVTAMIFGIIQLITSVLSIFVIDRLGRRNMLMFSCFGSALTMVALGIYFYVPNKIYWIPIPTLYLFSFFFNTGLADVGLILSGELYPMYIKPYGSAMGCLTYGAFGFITNKLFQPMLSLIGLHFVFWTYAGFAIVGFLYIYFFLPETNKKSLTEIQEMMHSNCAKIGQKNCVVEKGV